VSVLTYLTSAAIRDGVRQLEGEIISRPGLFKTDGVNLTYAADVRIAEDLPEGPPDPFLEASYSDRVLRNVPIAGANRDLVYAEAGAAVTLARAGTGRFEITGFAKRKPGRRIRVAVNLETYVPGEPEDVGLSARPLTYGELGDPACGGGYGSIPYGAYGVFRAGVLVEVRW
jgi:hypothetical protein